MSSSLQARRKQQGKEQTLSGKNQVAQGQNTTTGASSGANGHSKRHVLITGGAGFIGTNLADRLLSSGCRVLIYDNLSRRGSSTNLEWLAKKHPGLLRAEIRDVQA